MKLTNDSDGGMKQDSLSSFKLNAMNNFFNLPKEKNAFAFAFAFVYFNVSCIYAYTITEKKKKLNL